MVGPGKRTESGLALPSTRGEPWLALAVAVLRPLLGALTKRDWRGTEHLPRTGGVVVVANHLSHFDPLTMAHFVYDNGRIPRFLAKSGLFKVFFIGRLLHGAGQIPVFRESREAGAAFRAAVEAVNRGECVVVYPEGTVTRDPDTWPMVGKSGAARIALASGVPVVPVAQWGPQEVLAPYTKKLRLLPRKTVHVLAGPVVRLDDLRSEHPSGEALREATKRILDAVTALLEELRQQSAPAERFDPRAAALPRTGDPRRRKAG